MPLSDAKHKTTKAETMTNETIIYSTYFCHIMLSNGTGRILEVVACNAESAKADCFEAFGDATEVQVGWLR